ncbi:MAG: hypothetical protein NTW42_03360 [Deltaproteobacteria bacterium]|nr:hypothetical protein [Deltaproteobacteria bacterium]
MKTGILAAKIIVGSYLGLKAVQFCYSAIIINEPIHIIAARFVALLIPLLLAVFAFKNKIIAQWLLAITIIVGGITGLVSGVFVVPLTQYMLKTLFILLGIYLSVGGWILIKGHD